MSSLPFLACQALLRHRAKVLLLLMATAMTLVGVTSHAAPQKAKPERRQHELLGGVVTNQTITVAGYEFYRHFVTAWRDIELSERFVISVHERPSAGRGSLVWVEYGQQRIFQSYLPAARASIQPLSERAVALAQQRIIDMEVEHILFRNADLGADEI